jgi:hypothetical protein
MNFARLFVFNGLTAFLFRALAAYCSLEPRGAAARWRIGADEPANNGRARGRSSPGDLEKAEQALGFDAISTSYPRFRQKGNFFSTFPISSSESAIRSHRQWLWGQTRLDWFRRLAVIAGSWPRVVRVTAMRNGHRGSRCGIGRAAAIAAKLDFRSREIRSASAFAIVRFVEKILDRLFPAKVQGRSPGFAGVAVIV